MQKHNNLQLTDEQYLSLSKAKDLVELYIWFLDHDGDPVFEVNLQSLSTGFSVLADLLEKGLGKETK